MTPSLQPLLRLLQLASPALPVGAYTYSQGLEWAIEEGTVSNEATALNWIAEQLEWNIGRYEVPLLRDCLHTWQLPPAASNHSGCAIEGEADYRRRVVGAGDTASGIHGAPLHADAGPRLCKAEGASGQEAALALDTEYLATRETAELRAETVQMGYSMRRLLDELGDFPQALRDLLASVPETTFLLVWSCAAAHWQVPVRDALAAWCWSWAENQTMAALKAVPLGQAAGQRILAEVGHRIPAVVEHAMNLDRDNFSNFAPGFALACSRHETQYSRLFRS